MSAIYLLTDRMFSQDITERLLNVKFVFSWDFCGFLDYFLRVDHVIRLKKCKFAVGMIINSDHPLAVNAKTCFKMMLTMIRG